jgi:hypothetical protein
LLVLTHSSRASFLGYGVVWWSVEAPRMLGGIVKPVAVGGAVTQIPFYLLVYLVISFYAFFFFYIIPSS